MTRAFLAIGSNLGDRNGFLRGAVRGMPDVDAVSNVYETDPVGGPDQGAFLNAVVRLDTSLDARELLKLCLSLEIAAERKRLERWGPRTLDVDLLWVDGEQVDEPDLVVPHPRMFERAFVMVPLRDVSADIVPADWSDPDGESGVRLVGPL